MQINRIYHTEIINLSTNVESEPNTIDLQITFNLNTKCYCTMYRLLKCEHSHEFKEHETRYLFLLQTSKSFST